MRERDVAVLFLTGDGHIQHNGLALHWSYQEAEVLSVVSIVLVC